MRIARCGVATPAGAQRFAAERRFLGKLLFNLPFTVYRSWFTIRLFMPASAGILSADSQGSSPLESSLERL